MLSVVIVEDHSIVRYGVESLIEKLTDYKVVKSVGTGLEGLQSIKAMKPDVAIIDLNLPDISGESLIRDLFLNDIKLKTIILSRQKYLPEISHLLSLGINAYIVKDFAAEELPIALKEIKADKQFLSHSLHELLNKAHFTNMNHSYHITDQLSLREREIAKLVCCGLSSKVIAERFKIAPATVRVHTKNILHKLKVKNIDQLLSFRDYLAK